jgi:hypothetical protein
MKIAILLTGESFRFGSQMTRGRGIGDYNKRQLLASISHIKLVRYLQQFGLTVDLYINGYVLNEKDDTELETFYSKQVDVKNITLHKSMFKNENDYLNQLYDYIENTILPNDYDFVLMLRIDFYLKHYFFECFKLDSNKIQFAHFDPHSDLNEKNIGICHMLIVWPKKFYFCFLKKLFLNRYCHDIRFTLINAGIDIKSFGTIINTLHICSTDLGWNPLYIQVGRNYNDSYSTDFSQTKNITYYYNSEEEKFIFDPTKTIDFYESIRKTDSLNENLNSLPFNSFASFLQTI